MRNAQFAFAWKMINASICAYQIHEKGWVPGKDHHPKVCRRIEGPNKAYFYNVVPEYQDQAGFTETAKDGYAPLFTATGDDEINAALVGAMADGHILLALRGTIPPSLQNDDLIEWIKDWAQDADMPPTPWSDSLPPTNPMGNVETGFADAMRSLWPNIKVMIDKTLAAYPCTGIVLTGHSKGAALTFLAATLIAHHYPQFKGHISVHAFAAPVTGDPAFKSAYQAAGLGNSTHRYQVADDIVPFLPLWSDANIYRATHFKDEPLKLAWELFADLVKVMTKGGYEAVGDFTYFDQKHIYIPGAIVTETALPAVAAALEAGEIMKIADAHSATDSYRPCFKAANA